MSEKQLNGIPGQGIEQVRDVMLYCLVSLSQHPDQRIGNRLQRKQDYLRLLGRHLGERQGLGDERIELLCMAMPLK